ncbi:MAG: sugar ABC transporter substrate-binding protein [Elusimicrobiota bacterium]|nr:sugar ABC transporter substrate-binding protein [Endomicrobiia bacterium]MDW7973298.1 sugar ABC transporter substrate-binding protein [Thermodesulfovibrio sp.]MDW8166508.1 sugar ABC transporter substrate-binding protein [Elusimicrobiota bacterium]
MRFLIKISFLLLIFSFLLSFSGIAQKPIEIVFTFWGGPEEAKVMPEVAKIFEKNNPGITVKAMHIPWEDYIAKVSAMLAGGSPPTLGYTMETIALDWAEKGELLDILPLIRKDPDPAIKMENRLPSIAFWFDKKRKTLGTSVAAEVMVIWYNKEIFDKAGVPYPPTDPTKWTWKKFVETATKLTVDVNGKHPNEPGFDHSKVQTFGVAFGNWYMVWFPFIWSNGGDLCDPTGMTPTINKKEAVEGLQALVDLIYKHKVAPTPAQLGALPAYHIALQTRRVAMVIDGQWSLLELGRLVKAGQLKLGVAPLPILKRVVTGVIGNPIGIYTKAVKDRPEVLDAAWKFYKFLNNSETVLELLRNGLWMPIQKWWYTDPEYIKKWIGDTGIHPPEYKEAVIDYTLKYAKPVPVYYLRNFDKINDIMYQELSSAFLGKVSVQSACDEIAKKIAPLLKGRYDR